jgi:phage terminase small subunit
MTHGLTDKQKRFVDAYLVDFNANEAAARAGYRNPRRSDIGYKNLQNPRIRAAIDAAGAPSLARLGLNAERVLVELARIATVNVMDLMRIGEDGKPVVDLARLDRDKAAAMSEITIEDFPHARDPERRQLRRVRFRLYDKLAALRTLARLLGVPREAIEPDGDGPRQDPRQVARAIIAILEEAQLADEEEAASAEAEAMEVAAMGACRSP